MCIQTRFFNVCTAIARSLSTFTRDVPRTPRLSTFAQKNLFAVWWEDCVVSSSKGRGMTQLRVSWRTSAFRGPHCLFDCLLTEEVQPRGSHFLTSHFTQSERDEVPFQKGAKQVASNASDRRPTFCPCGGVIPHRSFISKNSCLLLGMRLHAIFEVLTFLTCHNCFNAWRHPAVVAGNEIFDTERKLARLSPPSRVSHTPRPRSSFKKAARCPGIASVGSDRSTNSLTRAVTRSRLGVGTKSTASVAFDPEHQLRLEIRALTSSTRLLSHNHARTRCLGPCGRGPNSWTRGSGKERGPAQHRNYLPET